MADQMIVIVSGQEFSVPAGTDVEAIRQQLTGTFPDVATASVNKGSKTISGVHYDTIEFQKRAGTKGSDLADALGSVPAERVTRGPVLPAHISALLRGQMAFGEAIGFEDNALQVVIASIGDSTRTRQQSQGEALCHTLDTLDAIAADVLPAGW